MQGTAGLSGGGREGKDKYTYNIMLYSCCTSKLLLVPTMFMSLQIISWLQESALHIII